MILKKNQRHQAKILVFVYNFWYVFLSGLGLLTLCFLLPLFFICPRLHFLAVSPAVSKQGFGEQPRVRIIKLGVHEQINDGLFMFWSYRSLLMEFFMISTNHEL